MATQAFARHLVDGLRRQAAEKRSRIGSGSCSSYEAYKQETGRAQGLEDAAAFVEVELKKYQRGEDEVET